MVSNFFWTQVYLYFVLWNYNLKSARSCIYWKKRAVVLVFLVIDDWILNTLYLTTPEVRGASSLKCSRYMSARLDWHAFQYISCVVLTKKAKNCFVRFLLKTFWLPTYSMEITHMACRKLHVLLVYRNIIQINISTKTENKKKYSNTINN